ncbi:MAG: holo-ACP synthase [Proteobacteria bacterium]|nr:holo-ACP synthase [Pseudomonadota bacterium]
MILGLGVDICPIERIEQALGRQHGDTFSNRVFTDGEREHAGTGVVMAERLAARFAAKEAAIKALGAPEGLRWRDMEVVSAEDGSPSLRLEGRAAERAKEMGVSRILLSLSHAGGVAVAVVIFEGDN